MSTIFKGFQIEYPEYEVKLPQTKLILRIRSVTTDEEMKLKTSLVGKRNNMELLNKTIYNCIIDKPEIIDTYEKFTETITLRDREALFSGLHHCSYGDDMEMNLTCPKCDYDFTVKLRLSEGVNIEEYPGEECEILKQRVDVQLDIVPAIFKIKEPTIKDEMDIMNNHLVSNEDPDFTSLFMITDKILYKPDKNSEDLQEIETLVDKIYAIKQIVPRDRKKIKQAYAENFGKYSMNFMYDASCPSCRNAFVLGVDIVEQFFRRLFES